MPRSLAALVTSLAVVAGSTLGALGFAPAALADDPVVTCSASTNSAKAGETVTFTYELTLPPGYDSYSVMEVGGSRVIGFGQSNAGTHTRTYDATMPSSGDLSYSCYATANVQRDRGSNKTYTGPSGTVTQKVIAPYGSLTCTAQVTGDPNVRQDILVNWTWTGDPTPRVDVAYPADVIDAGLPAVAHVSTGTNSASRLNPSRTVSGKRTITLTGAGGDADRIAATTGGAPTATCDVDIPPVGSQSSSSSLDVNSLPYSSLAPGVSTRVVDLNGQPGFEVIWSKPNPSLGFGRYDLWVSDSANGNYQKLDQDRRFTASCSTGATFYIKAAPTGGAEPATYTGTKAEPAGSGGCKVNFVLAVASSPSAGVVDAGAFWGRADQNDFTIIYSLKSGGTTVVSDEGLLGSQTAVSFTCVPTSVDTVEVTATHKTFPSITGSVTAPVTPQGPLPASCPKKSAPSSTSAPSTTPPGGGSGSTGSSGSSAGGSSTAAGGSTSASTGHGGASSASGGSAATVAPCLAEDGTLYPNLSGSVGSSLTMAPNLRVFGVPTSFAITAGALPPGLFLDGDAGVIYGVPTTAAVGTTKLTVTATLADGRTIDDPVTVVVDDPHHSLQYPNRVVGTFENPVAIFGSSHDASAKPRYAVVCGELPEGTVLNEKTGVITGTPAVGVQYPVPLRIRQSDGHGWVDASFIFVVGEDDAARFLYPSHVHVSRGHKSTITPSSLALEQDATFAVSSGTLPKGLTLDAATGRITGTPKELVKKPRVIAVTAFDAQDNPLETEIFDITVRKRSVPMQVMARKSTHEFSRNAAQVAVFRVKHSSTSTLSAKVACKGCSHTFNKKSGKLTVRPGAKTSTIEVTITARPSTKAAKKVYGPHSWSRTWKLK